MCEWVLALEHYHDVYKVQQARKHTLTLSVSQGSRLSRLFDMACMPVSDSLF